MCGHRCRDSKLWLPTGHSKANRAKSVEDVPPHKDSCKQTCAASFVMVPKWKQFKEPPGNEQRNKAPNASPQRGCDVITHKHRVPLQATTWVDSG